MSEFQEILPQRRRNNDKDLVDDIPNKAWINLLLLKCGYQELQFY